MNPDTRYVNQVMKPILLTAALTAATSLLLAGCTRPDAATEANFSAALDKHLTAHGDLCIGRHQWPVDVPDLPVAAQMRDGIQMPALEHAGLVSHVGAEMTLHHQNGEDEKVRALRYDLTDKGRQFVNASPHTAAHGAGASQPDLCYGRVRLAKVTGWDTPQKSAETPVRLTTTVRYTYTLEPAPWAGDASVQGAFPVLARVVKGSGKLELKQAMVATGGGWEPL